jgi:hypothetical protein
VDGQDGDRIGVRVEIRRRGVVTRLDERLQVARDEDRAVVGEER